MATPVHGLFEAHLTVSDLNRSVAFYRENLGLELASVFSERKVAFFWIGGRGHTMLGLWETGTAPQRMSLHIAFQTTPQQVLESPVRLREHDITPLDFFGHPTAEPSVLAWMPAASVYFSDPDGNQLEYIAMLATEPRPDLGVLSWSDWLTATADSVA
jgi:lactoylglutathione lyase